MKLRLSVLVCALACTVAACTSVNSDLTINGLRFGPDECRNGQTEEFFGVDLRDSRGLVLRLASQVDQTVSVIVIPNDGRRPVAMTNCATLSLRKSSHDDRGYYDIDGEANIDCEGPDFTVKGTTRFENCGRNF